MDVNITDMYDGIDTTHTHKSARTFCNPVDGVRRLTEDFRVGKGPVHSVVVDSNHRRGHWHCESLRKLSTSLHVMLLLKIVLALMLMAFAWFIPGDCQSANWDVHDNDHVRIFIVSKLERKLLAVEALDNFIVTKPTSEAFAFCFFAFVDFPHGKLPSTKPCCVVGSRSVIKIKPRNQGGQDHRRKAENFHDVFFLSSRLKKCWCTMHTIACLYKLCIDMCGCHLTCLLVYVWIILLQKMFMVFSSCLLVLKKCWCTMHTLVCVLCRDICRYYLKVSAHCVGVNYFFGIITHAQANIPPNTPKNAYKYSTSSGQEP